MITAPFPTPPALVSHALAQLYLAQAGTEEDLEEIGDPADLPRPWEPATCPPTLRRVLWDWLDEVAGWFNREYTWLPHATIPGCWPEHPHIVHELAVVAFQRLTALQALTPDRLEDWHRYTLPAFFDRMTARLGQGCPPGKHSPWPGRSRDADYRDGAAGARRASYDRDTGRAAGDPSPLRIAEAAQR
jgi:hypothetical protein